jgi:hypothetical protein
MCWVMVAAHFIPTYIFIIIRVDEEHHNDDVMMKNIALDTLLILCVH